MVCYQCIINAVRCMFHFISIGMMLLLLFCVVTNNNNLTMHVDLAFSPLFLIIQEKNTYPLFKIEKRKGGCRPLLAIRNDDLLRRRGCTSSTVETVSSHNNFGRFLFLPLFYSFSFLFFYTSAPDIGGTSFFLTHQDAKNKNNHGKLLRSYPSIRRIMQA